MSALEQTPYYTLKHLEDGNEEKLQLAVQLPGVKSAAELQVNVTEDQVVVHVPGRYKLVLPVDVRVNSKPQMLRFVKKKAVLKAELEVTGPANTGRGPRASAKPVHDSFMEDTLRRRDGSHMRYPDTDEAGPGPSSSGSSMRRRDAHLRQPYSDINEPGPGPSSSGSSMRPRDSYSYDSETEQAGPGPSSSGASMVSEASRRRNQRASALFQEALSMSRAEPSSPKHYITEPTSVAKASPASAEAEQKPHPTAKQNGGGSETASFAPQGLKRGFFGAKAPVTSRARPEADGPDNTSKNLDSSKKSDNLSATTADVNDSAGQTASVPEPVAAGPKLGADLTPARPNLSPPASAGKQDIYQEGKQHANREAAQEFFRKGLASMDSGEHARAIYLLQKAARLSNPEDLLTKDIHIFVNLAQIAQKAAAEKAEAEAAGRSAPTAGNDTSKHSSEAPGDESEISHDYGDDASSGSIPDSMSDAEDGPSDAYHESSAPHGASARASAARAAYSRLSRVYNAAKLVGNVLHAMLTVAIRMGNAAVPRVLPYIAAKLGRPDDERWLRSELNPGSQHRTPLLVLSYIASAVIIGSTTWFAYWASRLVLAISWGLLASVWRIAVGIMNVGFWRPAWWFTWPLSGLLGWQSKNPLLGAFWCYPLMWWASGGTWWAVTGSVVTVALAVLGGSIVLGAGAWTVVSWEIRWLSWWLAVPAVLVTLFGWLLLCSRIAETGSRQPEGSAEGPLLSTSVPPGATGEVARVLGSGDFFQVLELGRDCTDPQVRKAKKLKALATHPDKLGADAVGASLAFQRITQAAEILGDSSSRRTYTLSLEAEEAARYSGRGSTAEGVADGTAMACSACNSEHHIIATDRPLSAARWCDQCQVRHPAKDGDGWLETSKGFFPTTQAYVASGGVVFDITAWVHCGNLAVDSAGNPIPANTHNAPLRFTNLGTKTGAPTTPPEKAAHAKGGRESASGTGSKRVPPSRKRNSRRR